MKIEWFVQYYYSAEDVYRAKKMQWVVTLISIGLQIVIMVNNHDNVYMIMYYILISLIIFGISIWILRGYEKSKIEYRKSMNRCKDNVSELMKEKWNTYKGKELTWKRDCWITIPQVGLMFIFMVLAILSIIKV